MVNVSGFLCSGFVVGPGPDAPGDDIDGVAEESSDGFNVVNAALRSA